MLFSLYINDQIVDKIVLHTNSEIEKSKLKYAVPQCSFINQTDKTEIKAFIGILFMSGVLKNSGLCLDDMFSESESIYFPLYNVSKKIWIFTPKLAV